MVRTRASPADSANPSVPNTCRLSNCLRKQRTHTDKQTKPEAICLRHFFYAFSVWMVRCSRYSANTAARASPAGNAAASPVSPNNASSANCRGI